MRCWTIVQNTKHGIDKKNSYTFEQHVYVCIYDCINGFSTAHTEYLPRFGCLNQLLIRKCDLFAREHGKISKQELRQNSKTNRKGVLTSRKLKKASVDFHKAIAECESVNSNHDKRGEQID